MKTILIVSGGVEGCPAIAQAKQMGLKVVCSDLDPAAPGFALADAHFVASTYDAEETLRGAEQYVREHGPLDGVITVGADVPMTVARVAAHFSLPGISVESARLATDKLAMKQRFVECGVPVPWFSAVESADHLRRLIDEKGRNLVIKPVDSRGSRGVQRLANHGNLDEAFAFAQAYSPTRRVMVEQYMPGPQVSTESVVVDGVCYTPGFSDRNYELLDTYAPFFIENGVDMPSLLPADIQERIQVVQGEAAAALGVINGTVKGDIVVHEGVVYVIELAARLSGGFFCSHDIPYNTGVDFVGASFRVALGEKPTAEELTPKYQKPTCQRYSFPPAGKVIAISGAEEARQVPGVEDLIITARLGDIIPPAGDKRPSGAMVIATGASREEARVIAKKALSHVHIQTQ